MKTKALLNKKIDRIQSFSIKSPELLFPGKILKIRLENGLNLLFEGERIPNHPNKQGLKVLEHALVIVNRHNEYVCKDIVIRDGKIIDIGYLSNRPIETTSLLHSI